MPRNSQLTVLIVLVALLLSFLGIIFVIVPRISTLKTLSDQVAAKQAELDAGRQEVQSLKAAVQLIQSAQKDIETLGIAVPNSPKADEALVQLSQAATQAGLTVKSAAISPSEDQSITFTVSTDGQYNSAVSFIANMEKNLRPVAFIDYTLSATQNSSVISATFNISFPYIEEEETATTTATSTESEEGAINGQ